MFKFLNNLKSAVSLLLIGVIIAFVLTGCTQSSDCTVKTDGTVSVISDVLLTQEEYSNLMSGGGEVTTEPGTTITDVTVDGVMYKKMSQTKTYSSLNKFKEDVMSSFESEITTKDLWFFSEGNADIEQSMITVNLIFTMPYKIVKTNGVKTGDYTVEFNNVTSGKYYYLATNVSTAEWTKVNDIEGAIKKSLLDKVNVANFKFSPQVNSTLKSVTLKNVGGYTVINGKNYFDNAKLSYIEVYRKTGTGKYVKIGTKDVNKSVVKNTIYTDKTVKPNKKYIYKIRGVYKEGNFVKYSSFSSAKSVVIKPNCPVLSVKSSVKAAQVSWKKIKGVTGYQVYRSVKKNSGYKKIQTIKASVKSYVDKSLKSKKIYYYKVRSYKKVNGKSVYSNWSNVKKVKIK